jgi:hypothetical protein
MGLQFYNINTSAYVKPVSRVNNTNKVTSLKKNSRRKQVGLTADYLAFLRSLNAI